MAQDLNDSDFLVSTTEATLSADHLSLVVVGESNEMPFVLAEGDTIQIIKTPSGGTPVDLNDGVELAVGVVPSGGSPAFTWTTTIVVNVRQEPKTP